MPVSIVLVEPENPDNIGAVCRAMKNMALSDLRLVHPPAGWKEAAKKMAVSAKDLLEKAAVFSSTKDALSDSHFVVGTTRRERNIWGVFVPFDDAIRKIQTLGKSKRVALVFGKESKGLSNEDLMQCHTFTRIPSSSACPSINLAQAVMVMAFCLFPKGTSEMPRRQHTLLSKREIDEAVEKFGEAVFALGYKPVIARRIGVTFHAILKRGGLLQSESQMIRGISRRIKERIKPAPGR